MTGELNAGAVVEIQVGKYVFVGVVIDTNETGVWVDMDGRLKMGTQVSLYDPTADCALQGKISHCAPSEAGGFRLQITPGIPVVGGSVAPDPVFVWPPYVLHYAPA